MVRYLWKTVVIAVLLALLLVLAPAPYAIYDAYADIIELPIDIKEGGMPFTKIRPLRWTSYGAAASMIPITYMP